MDVLSRIEDSNFDCLLCIYLISQHGDNIGIHHRLVKKLSTYKYSELEFLIPQLIQLLLSYETESMALHDLILQLSESNPHFCLLSFWNLQAYVFELKGQPESYSFHTVRSFINELQNSMFNHKQPHGVNRKFRENVLPSLMLGAAIGASIGMPAINDYIKPIVISQSRQQKSILFKLASFQASLTENLTLKNKGRSSSNDITTKNNKEGSITPETTTKRYSESNLEYNKRPLKSSSDYDYVEYDSDTTQNITKSKYSIHSTKVRKNKTDAAYCNPPGSFPTENRIASLSMPDLGEEQSAKELSRLLSWLSLSSTEKEAQKISESFNDTGREALKTNYFKKELEFIIVLQNISSTLSQIPREARLTGLRAELSIINNTMLPSEIDIPQLFPANSVRNKKFHRILKLNISEACVLNSAERVPYLLLIEYLSDDMDFDPSTYKNKDVLLSFDSANGSNTPKNGYTAKLGTRSVVDTTEEETDLSDYSALTLSYKLYPQTSSPGVTQQSDNAFQLQSQHPDNSLPNMDTRSDSKSIQNLKVKDLSSQIRIAAVMLKQLEKYGQANSEQSAAIKSRIVKSMEDLQDQFETFDYEKLREMSGNQGQQDAGNRKIENDFKIGEDWYKKKERIRKTSIYGHLPHWDLCSVIVKNGDDLQQEAFACQLISLISNFWRSDGVKIWTKDMKIVVTSYNSGLVETINNALSVHSIKKAMTESNTKKDEDGKGAVATIKDYFLRVYGNETTVRYRTAQENFARSLAAYSIICYALQIKDRHNGNIMLDNEGHIMHIDFGFILSNSPGSVGFEAAPFKLTTEYVEVLGGVGSSFYELFENLCKECFISLRNHCNELVNLVELMQKDSSLPCFKSGVQTPALLKQRLQLELSDEECLMFVTNNLIGKSFGSMYTRLYDQFQLLTQGIYA